MEITPYKKVVKFQLSFDFDLWDAFFLLLLSLRHVSTIFWFWRPHPRTFGGAAFVCFNYLLILTHCKVVRAETALKEFQPSFDFDDAVEKAVEELKDAAVSTIFWFWHRKIAESLLSLPDLQIVSTIFWFWPAFIRGRETLYRTVEFQLSFDFDRRASRRPWLRTCKSGFNYLLILT